MGNISAAGNTLRVEGNRLKVNDVSAGAGGTVLFTSSSGAEVAGSIGGAGTLRVDAQSAVDFTRNGTASSGSPSLSIAGEAS